jgi:hypothetical protein
MITIVLSEEDTEVLLRALQTVKATGGDERFVIIPLIENIKAMQGDSQRPFCNRNLMTDQRSLGSGKSTKAAP